MSLNAGLQVTQEAFSATYPATFDAAATVSPLTAVSFVSGSTQIATITPPVSAPHILTFIFLDVAPGEFLTTGNIAAAVTPLPSNATLLQYEPRTAKYYPLGTGSSVVNLVAGADGDVQFNTGDEFDADAAFNFDGTSLTVPGDTLLLSTETALANGAGALTGTLTNSPATGNPTKWIAINDAGTVRLIPTWPAP